MSVNIEKNARIVVVTGHFGSGKTNFAVNLAMKAARAGRKVTLIDLDIVNPYFRAADNREALEALGVRCIIPEFANTNVDIPTLPPDVASAFEAYETESDRLTIFDVGGDNGAVALGMYGHWFEALGYELLCTLNCYRPLTEDEDDALEGLREIEAASRLHATGLVNTSNLGAETTAADVLDSIPWAERIAKKAGLPLVCTAAMERIADGLVPVERLFTMESVTKTYY